VRGGGVHRQHEGARAGEGEGHDLSGGGAYEPGVVDGNVVGIVGRLALGGIHPVHETDLNLGDGPAELVRGAVAEGGVGRGRRVEVAGDAAGGGDDAHGLLLGGQGRGQRDEGEEE